MRASQDEQIAGDRCWACTVTNAAIGLLIAWLPFGAALVSGRLPMIVATVVWGVVVTGYTGYRIVRLGYLPVAEPVAKLTGLHERIGPGSKSGRDRYDDEQDGG